MIILFGSALAAAPTPDRPSISRSGALVAPNSLELEVGGQWLGAQRTAPILLKYSVAGIVEPRIAADLAGIDGATPSLALGAKVRLIRTDTVALAAYLDSTLPVTSVESWRGTVAGLFTCSLEAWTIQANLGVVLREPVDEFGALQVAVAGGRQLTRSFSAYVEVGADQAGDRFDSFVVDAGVGWQLTEIVIFDGAFGWDFVAESPYAALGLTVNFGTLPGRSE